MKKKIRPSLAVDILQLFKQEEPLSTKASAEENKAYPAPSQPVSRVVSRRNSQVGSVLQLLAKTVAPKVQIKKKQSKLKRSLSSVSRERKEAREDSKKKLQRRHSLRQIWQQKRQASKSIMKHDSLAKLDRIKVLRRKISGPKQKVNRKLFFD